MKDNSVKVSTSVKAEESANGEARRLEHEFTYAEPTSLEEAVSIVGEEKALDLLTSEWRTRLSNGIRGKMRELLKTTAGEETIISQLQETFADWNPSVSLAGSVDVETALRNKLASMSPEEAAAFLQKEMERILQGA